MNQVYEKNNTFEVVYPECKFGRLVHLTNHSSVISKRTDDQSLPVYEGKFIEIYTGKYATFAGVSEKERYRGKASARLIEDIEESEYPEARFFIKKDAWQNISKNIADGYVIAWRSLTSATNKRTMLATILPKIPTCQSIQLLQMDSAGDMLKILAVFNSVIFDYLVRLKMAGLDLTQTIVKQIPVPDRERWADTINFNGVYAPIESHVNSRLYALYQCDIRIEEVFKGLELYPVFGERKRIISELDKLVAILYGIGKGQIKEIAGRFDKYYTPEEIEMYF